MDALLTTELVLGILVGLALCALIFVWLRRRVIAGGRTLMLCALRTEADPRWRLGHLRMADQRLEWYSVLGPSTRPARAWGRHELDISAPQPLDDLVPGLPPDAVCVAAESEGLRCGLAFGPQSAMAVRAWLESSPPGFNVNVA